MYVLRDSCFLFPPASNFPCLADWYQAVQPETDPHQEPHPGEKAGGPEIGPSLSGPGAASMPHAILTQGKDSSTGLFYTILSRFTFLASSRRGAIELQVDWHYSSRRKPEESHDGLVFCWILHRSSRGTATSAAKCSC